LKSVIEFTGDLFPEKINIDKEEADEVTLEPATADEV
jgi:hypothetical protein